MYFQCVLSIFILFFILFLSLFIFIYNSPRPSISHLTLKTNVTDIIENCKTGDLLFFRGIHYGDNVISFITQCPFSHVSMIIKENNVAYLWEADVDSRRIGDKHYKIGPRVIPLYEKLKNYGGLKIGGYRKIRKTRGLNNKDILMTVKKYINYSMDTDQKTYISEFFSREKNTVFCSELLALTLQQCKLLHKEKRATAYSPCYFFKGLKTQYLTPRLFYF
jgi:hypothetical protein